MTKKGKNILVFSVFLILASFIYSWFYILNKGTLEVITNRTEYNAEIDSSNNDCTKNPCKITLKIGGHNLLIKKKGFFTEKRSITINRWKNQQIKVNLNKVPSLELTTTSPITQPTNSDNIPKKIKEMIFAWNKNKNKIAYIDTKDNKIKIWNKENKEKIISTIKNISANTTIHWSPNDNFLVIINSKNTFIINIEKTSKKKIIMDFEPQNIIWSNKNKFILMNNKKIDLFKLNIKNWNIKPLDFKIDLASSVLDNNDDLFFFKRNNETSITTISVLRNMLSEKIGIIKKSFFSISEIITDDNNKIYLYNPDSASWYKLSY